MRGCALMKPAFGLAPFHQQLAPHPRQTLPARSIRPLTLSPFFFVFASHGSISLLCPVPSPFPSTDGPEGERLPLALWPADGKGFLTSPLPISMATSCLQIRDPAEGDPLSTFLLALHQRMGPSKVICSLILSGAASLNLTSL